MTTQKQYGGQEVEIVQDQLAFNNPGERDSQKFYSPVGSLDMGK